MRIPLEIGWLDLSAGLFVRGGASEALRPMETRLLRYLAGRAGQAIPQHELLAQVWGYAPQVRSRTVRVTVSRLRSRIERDPAQPRHLITVTGEGYALTPVGTAFSAAPGLIGRTDDLAAIAEALTRHPVVELVGIGGIGKTAVARVVAAGNLGSLWFEARGADGADQVEVQAAATLGVPTSGLLHAVAQAPLVVLDEVEGIPGVQGLIETWSRLTRVLVTSRVRLGLPTGATYELPPLSEEATGRLLRGVWSRASLADPPDIAPLVRAMGGLPLAVALSGAWAPLCTPADLAARIGTDALADVLAQSLTLLTGPQRAALVALSVCPTGASLAQAGQLTALPHLLTLRRHSLLQRDGGRLFLLTPVRAHILAQADTAAAALRHAQVYGVAAAEAVGALQTPGQSDAWQWIVSDVANVRLALTHPAQSAERRLALLQCLDAVGLMLGPARLHAEDLATTDGLDADGLAWHRLAEGRRLREAGALEAAVHQGQQALDRATPGWVSSAAEQLARSLVYAGRQQEAWRPAEQAVATATSPEQAACALRGVANLHRFAGRGVQATSLFEEASRAATSPGLRAGILSDLGEHVGGERGLALLEEALSIQDALGLDRDRAATLLRRGYLQPTHDQRFADYQTSQQVALEIGVVRIEVHASLRLAQWAMEGGRHEQEDAVTAAICRADGIGDPNLVAILTLNRAHMRTDREAYALAEEDYRAALSLYEQIGMPLYTGTGLFMGGQGAAVAGNYILARQRLHQARICWAEEPAGLPQIQALLALLEGRVGGGSEAEPWFRWAVEGGARPTAPDPAVSWTARQLATGRLKVPPKV